MQFDRIVRVVVPANSWFVFSDRALGAIGCYWTNLVIVVLVFSDVVSIPVVFVLVVSIFLRIDVWFLCIGNKVGIRIGIWTIRSA